jgi:hypothetical protein
MSTTGEISSTRRFLLNCLGVTIGLFLVFGIFSLLVYMEEDPEQHVSWLTIDNDSGNTTFVEIYVLDGGQWDFINLTLENGTEETVRIKWEGGHPVLRVFIVADIYYPPEENIWMYTMVDKQIRIVMLIA